MYRRPAKYLTRAVIATVVVLCVAATIRYASAQASTWGSYLALVRDLRALDSAEPSGVTRDVVFDVPYRGATFTVLVPTDTGYIAAARRVDGSALFGFNRAVRAAAMRAFARQQRDDPFVTALGSRLRHLGAQLELSDDDRVDLMIRAVQAIPYGTLHRSTFMPVATVDGNRGVCADKSVLLAALLAHEGYDAGVWVFPTQAHAAVAVRGAGPGLRGSTYTLVETTRLTYVGEIDYTLRAAGPVCETPQLIAFGDGTKRYTRDLETEFIADTLERVRGPRRLIPTEGEAQTRSETAEKGAQLPSGWIPSARLADWIDSRRDWPEATYDALAASGPDR